MYNANRPWEYTKEGIKRLNDCRKTHKPISKKLPTKGEKRGGSHDNKFIKIGGVQLF